MESFRLVCRDGRGEWYMHEADAESALAAFERTTASLREPFVVIPARLGRSTESSIVQRWKLGASELGDCLNCSYDLKGLIRPTDGLAICPECGVGAVMKPRPVDPLPDNPLALPFKQGELLATWAMVFSLIGLVFVSAAFLGIAMGVLAHEMSRGKHGFWGMRIGTAALVIHAVILAARIFGIRF